MQLATLREALGYSEYNLEKYNLSKSKWKLHLYNPPPVNFQGFQQTQTKCLKTKVFLVIVLIHKTVTLGGGNLQRK